MLRRFLTAALAAISLATIPAFAADAKPAKKIVLIAGKKSHGPVGNGQHDYPWSVKLLKVLLDNSNVRDQVRVEFHLDGWPTDERAFDDAATIMVISDGRDGDRYEDAPHLSSDERVAFVDRLMKRGCGLVAFHFSTFAPDKYGERVLDWNGGYFDWETDGKRQWYSAIKWATDDVKLASPGHPIGRGLPGSFPLKDEFYYRIRFRPNDERFKPIMLVPALGGGIEEHTVGWAVERKDGGRGFATTAGHAYSNWQDDHFRKLILNALVWSAGVDVPEVGVESRFVSHAEIDAALTGVRGSERAVVEPPFKALLLAGNDKHKWHNWERTTPAIKAALERDLRLKVDVSTDIEELAKRDLGQYQLLVQNYVNWQDPTGISDAARAAFLKFVGDGGGVLFVHFANGAFHESLPGANGFDWPEYRKLVLRVWHHGKGSAHDAFGRFTVNVTPLEHPITAGLKDFDVTDELYHSQFGDAAVEPLITAVSKQTKQPAPLAWVHHYGRGRVFQTLLGHSEKTYDSFEAREMLRRAAAWVANRKIRPLSPADDPGLDSGLKSGSIPSAKPVLVDGRFDKALDARVAPLSLPGKDEYRLAPLTVECWVKLFASSKDGYNILLASESKSSPRHWEMFTHNGRLTVYLPGAKPDHVAAPESNLTDDQWHYVAMQYEPERIRLFLDGKEVASQTVSLRPAEPARQDFVIGGLVERNIGCRGLLDEVRLSRGVRSIHGVPEKPFDSDDQTLGVWHLDELP